MVINENTMDQTFGDAAASAEEGGYSTECIINAL